MDNNQFNFLLYRSPDDGILFISIDSLIGYLRRVSQELIENSDDPRRAVLSAGLSALSIILDDMYEEKTDL